MFRARNFVPFLLLIACAFAEESNKPLADTKKIVADPQPPITVIPTNSTPTAAPTNSTTVAPSTSSEKPNPPSTTPEPTTPPTTSKPTTPPTTPKPTPAPTTPKPTPAPTTPKPTPAPTTPAPTPANDNWIVTGNNGTKCITASMVMKITVPYKSSENKTVESPFSVEHVQNATASGTCSGENDTETLVLTWGPYNVSATFTFFHNSSKHTYALDNILVVIPVNNNTFPNNTMVNVTEVRLSYKGELFSVPVNNSYTCTTVAPLSLTGTVATNTTVSGKLTVAHVHVQAFGVENTGKYRAPMDCASTETPDIVPIAVGLVLAGLVVVVLVAYLIGRRRAQARGYLSM